MKIKVGDLTIKEKHNLCKKSICSRCPLYVYNQNPILSSHDMCAASYPEGYDIVVDFPEDCVDWDVRLPEGIKEVVLNSIDFDKDQKVETQDNLFSEEDHVIIGTHWNSQQGPDGYRLQFETDNKQLYLNMEKTAQTCIDIACANRKD